MTANPLLDTAGLPHFSAVLPEHVEPAVDQLLTDNRTRLQALLERGGPYSWENLVQPLEEMENRLSQVWSPVRHLNAVMNSDALRAAYNACLQKLTEYATEIGQNRALYEAFRSIKEGPAYARLDPAQRRIIANALRDFHLAGVDLSPEDQARYKAIQQELSRLTSQFEEHVLDATHGWNRHVMEPDELAGFPESARQMARQTAQQKGLEGWLFTLEFPSYVAVVTYADSRALRRELYEAYVTRASDQGPNAGSWDNSAIMNRILELRHELARITGFVNFAQRSLATKMARTPQQVLEFLHDLARRSRPRAEQELAELRALASERYGAQELEAWDVAYYTEKLRQHRYALSQEDLKPYFPEHQVLEGLFNLVERLYGLHIREVHGVDTWHQDVRFFRIFDAQHELRGEFYLDLYARPNKRGGAWMDECRSRMQHGQEVQVPVAFLTCNLSPPVGDKPAMFTHTEVITLVQECGHGLHHLATRIDYPSVAGINGVLWDAVELPSQFMENWCWEREALDLISGQYETGAPLPDTLFERLRAAKNFQSGMQTVRQLEFALFDFRLHLEYDPARGARIQETLDEVRAEVAVLRPPAFNRFQHSFAHIFAGGYAAGYYSYKWAEVLSADAFALFEEHGLFDPETGQRFLRSILEPGGSRDPMELFVEFRGREPSIDALLRHSGIAA